MPPKVRFTCDLDPQLYAWLEKMMGTTGESRNALLDRAVRTLRQEMDPAWDNTEILPDEPKKRRGKPLT
jgi:hypothetical protein